MNLLVFSDSHGRARDMLAVMAREGAAAEACFFLGDGAADAEKVQRRYPAVSVYIAQGNGDFSMGVPGEGQVLLGGVLVYYTHGHTWHVKSDLDALWWHAHSLGAGVALFGHTHVPYYEYRNGIHLFNPGSVSLPRFGSPSYGRVCILEGAAAFEIVKL